MRKNTREVWNAWKQGKRHEKYDSIWTDGQVIYSYGTWLLKHQPIGKYLFNVTRYSKTTTNHQSGLGVLMDEMFPNVSYKIQVIEVDDVLRGSK